MKKISIYTINTFSVFFALIFFWFSWKLLIFFVSSFALSPAPVQAAIIAGVVTLFASISTLILSTRNQSKREIEAEHRKQKSEIYEEFIKFSFDLIHKGEEKSNSPAEEEAEEFMIRFTRRMIIWGSDEVLKEYVKFKDFFAEGEQRNLLEQMNAITNLLFAIRRDLGHQNKDLSQYELLSVFIKDVKEHVNPPTNQ